MEEKAFSLLTIPSRTHQKIYTALVALCILFLFAIVFPFANIQLPEIKPFLPGYIAVVIFTDWMTSYLLWGQYRITQSASHLCLAITYFFSGLVAIPHILTFPNVFSPSGLLGAGSQTAVYLWCLWHGGFPLGLIIFYAVNSYFGKTKLTKAMLKALPMLFVLMSITAMIFTVILTTRFHNVLPTIIDKGDYTGLFAAGIGQAIILLNVVAVILFAAKKDKRLLDLLLLLAAMSFLADVLLTLQGSARYTIGWYAARITNLLSSSIILGAFVLELNKLYIRLGRTHKQLEGINEQLEQQLVEIAKQKWEITKSEEKYRLVVDHIHEVVFLIGRQHQLVYVNPYWATLTGYTWEESKATNLIEFVHPDEREKARGALDSLMYEGKCHVSLEVRLIHRKGHVVWAQLFARAVRSEDGTVHEIHGTLRDATEQRGKFEIERNRVLGELAVAICHEVRNPLTATKGFLQLLQEEAASENIYLNISMEELEKAERVLGDYLRFSKPDVQKMEGISVGELLVYCVNVIEAYARSHNVRIMYSLQPQLYVQADREMLSQALINIMKNGIEAMPDGGILTVSAFNRETQTFIEIYDTGTGMTGEQILRLGEPFYTLKEKGTGLGMMMTYQFVYAMKGEIFVDSKVGLGTKVAIVFPTIPDLRPEPDHTATAV